MMNQENECRPAAQRPVETVLDEFEVFRLWLATNDKGLYAHDTWLSGEGVAGE